MVAKPGGTPVGGKHDLAIPFRSVRALLEAFDARDPDKVALVDLDQNVSITYGTLRREANRIARFLEQRGVGPGDHVGLLSDERLEKLLIWVGIWRLGAVVCPLNVEMNIAYIPELLRVLKPSLTLWHESLDGARMTEGVGGAAVRFGRWSPDLSAEPAGDDLFAALAGCAATPEVSSENKEHDLACVYCTSGTTDKPRLVACDHLSYWLFGLSGIEQSGVGENDNTLEFRSFGWNSAQGMSLMPWLLTGCTLHMARRFSHGRFFEWVKKHRITFSVGIPTVVNMLVNKPVAMNREEIASLRAMSCSTAPLAPEVWRRFEEMYGIRLLQMYGSSEGGWVCGNRHYACKFGTVGPPAKHQEFEIVDADGRPCPPGVEGEVTVGGPQCACAIISADGEWEDLRGKRFRMGDLAVMDEEGFVTITGRLKDVIIRGGVNISPFEIDNAVMSHPAVLEAATIGVADPIYGEEVVAYVVTRPGETVDAAALRRHCAELLPDYKAPKKFRFADDLPKNDRGKVKRDLLRARWESEPAPAA
jgi:acyl-coenzyme A synthetase/AMP-(fatty) acid ligase